MAIFNVDIIDLINNLTEKFRGFEKEEKFKPYLKKEQEETELKDYNKSDPAGDNFNIKRQVNFHNILFHLFILGGPIKYL